MHHLFSLLVICLGMNAEAQTWRCFEQFLFADMISCGAGVLPEGVGGMHAEFLDGPFVLQVWHCIIQLGEMVTILCPGELFAIEIHTVSMLLLVMRMFDRENKKWIKKMNQLYILKSSSNLWWNPKQCLNHLQIEVKAYICNLRLPPDSMLGKATNLKFKVKF